MSDCVKTKNRNIFRALQAVKLNHCRRSVQFENYSRKLQTIQDFSLGLKLNRREGNNLVLMWEEVFT